MKSLILNMLAVFLLSPVVSLAGDQTYLVAAEEIEVHEFLGLDGASTLHHDERCRDYDRYGNCLDRNRSSRRDRDRRDRDRYERCRDYDRYGNCLDRNRRGRRPVEYICYAENARGILFKARDERPRIAQHRAMTTCERNSLFPRTCRPLGCR